MNRYLSWEKNGNGGHEEERRVERKRKAILVR